jgi:putative transposase
MDFVSDSLCTGRRLKFLTAADDYSHECVQMAVDFGMGAGYVTRLLDGAAVFRGYPKVVRTDTGPEFTAKVFLAWAQQRKVEHIWIEPGCPTQNARETPMSESFSATLRDECLNEHWFTGLA